MCCNLQTHTIVISSLCLLFTGFSSAITGLRVIPLLFLPVPYSLIPLALLIWILFAIISEIMSIVGASRKNERQLIPFIITLVLEILAYFGLGVYYGTTNDHPDGYEIGGLSIGVVMRVYFLVVVVAFYRYCTRIARGITPEVA